MKTRDFGLVIAGLIVGALIGALIASSSNQVPLAAQAQVVALEATVSAAPTPVLRTVNEAAAISDFFIIPFEAAQTWLVDDAKLPMEEEMTAALPAIVTDVTDTDTLAAALADDESSSYTLLKTVYDDFSAKLPDGGPLATCLALENDIFEGTTILYFYVQVPKESDKALAISEDWKLLDGPLPNSELWTSDCYEGAAAAEATPEATIAS